MADKSRERNYVDAFSDYGLDERQIAIQNKIMTKCFKILYYGIVILTCIWVLLGTFEITVPFMYIALSYFLLAIVCSSIYAVQASKCGVINGITAFQWSGKGQAAAILFSAVIIFCRALSQHKPINNYWICLAIIVVSTIIHTIILNLCGKRNFKALDEDNSEDTEETEE